MPLSHPPGEAQVDYGEVTVKLNGVETKVALFVMTLPYSGAIHVQAFPRECTETFLEFPLNYEAPPETNVVEYFLCAVVPAGTITNYGRMGSPRSLSDFLADAASEWTRPDLVGPPPIEGNFWV